MTKPTLVLLPGLICDDARWSHQTQALGHQFDVRPPILTGDGGAGRARWFRQSTKGDAKLPRRSRATFNDQMSDTGALQSGRPNDAPELSGEIAAGVPGAEMVLIDWGGRPSALRRAEEPALVLRHCGSQRSNSKVSTRKIGLTDAHSMSRGYDLFER